MVKLKRSGQSGFSLVETMMAMLLLAISFLALGQLVAVAANQNALSRNTSVGIAVAMGKLEELRRVYNQQLAAGALNLTSGSATQTMRFDNSAQGSDDSNARVGSYNVSWQITPLSANEFTIKVTAEPTERNRYQSKSVEIVSHFSP